MPISGSKIPGIPDPHDTLNCLMALKEISELRNGLIGPVKNGQRLDRFITLRELEKLILSNAAIAEAIAYSISITIGFNDPVDTVISGDIITLDPGSGMVTAESETGTTDDVNQIVGPAKGNSIYLLAASGHTLTINHGTYLKLPSPTWTLVGNRIATFDCIGGGICVMRSHESNRT